MVLGEWGLLPHPKIIFVLLRRQVHFLFIFHNQQCLNFSMIYNIWVDWFLILIIDFCFRTSGSIVKLLDVVCPPERRRVIKVCLNFEWPNREKNPCFMIPVSFHNLLSMQLILFVVSCILVYRYLKALDLIFIFQQKQQNGDALDTAREFSLKHNIPVHYWIGKEGWEPQNG